MCWRWSNNQTGWCSYILYFFSIQTVQTLARMPAILTKFFHVFLISSSTHRICIRKQNTSKSRNNSRYIGFTFNFLRKTVIKNTTKTENIQKEIFEHHPLQNVLVRDNFICAWYSLNICMRWLEKTTKNLDQYCTRDKSLHHVLLNLS